MATVRNLNGNNPPLRTQNRMEDAVTKAEIAELPPPASNGIAVPGDDLFDDLPKLPSNQGIAVAQQMGGSGAPYVARAHPNAKNWGSLQAAQVHEGDLYVAFEGQYVRTMPLKMWLVDYVQFKTLHNDQGAPIYATTDLNAQTTPHGQKLDEHTLCLVVADVGDRLVPAQADFRGTMSGAISNLAKLYEAAKAPKFALTSEASRIAAAFPHPWGRVVGSAMTSKRIAKTTGRPYYAGSCSARPATLTELERLAAALSDPQFLALASEAKESYRQRFETLLNLSQKK